MNRDAKAATALCAWQGIEVEVPEAWELGAYQGDANAGSFRLDDGVDIRLNVRWTQSRSPSPTLRTAIERCRREVAKRGKDRLSFSEISSSFLPKSTREATAFEWRLAGPSQAGFGLATFCRTCRRIVLAEVLFPNGSIERKLAQRILSSLRDHRDDGLRTWSVYGFRFEILAALRLDRANLEPGRLRFLFRSGKRTWLRVERWGLASQWAHDTPLERWPSEWLKFMRAGVRSQPGVSETECRGHRAVAFHAARVPSGWWRRESIDGLVWRCPEDDAIYALAGNGGTDAIPEEVARNIQCG